MFIGRRQDGTIYGCWTCKQPQDADHPGMEEVADDLPELVAFLAPKASVSAKQAPPSPVDAIISDPAQLAALKAALAK